MAYDIFNPEYSQVVKGMAGKAFLLYGGNGVGKTLNAAKAPKPYFICFEKGLGAISGVAHANIKKWTEFTSIVKQFTSKGTMEKAKEMYQTIVLDGIENLGLLADPFVAGKYGVTSVSEGKKGYGLWKEFEDELRWPIKELCDAGYTVLFLGHAADRDVPSLKPNEKGEYKAKKQFPKGEKRAIDVIMNECDVIGYIQAQPSDVSGNEVLSKIYFANNIAFQAKTRFKYLPRTLDAWSYEKLEAALKWAIEKEESESGKKAISLQESLDKIAEEKAAEAEDIIPLDLLVERIGLMLMDMKDKKGNVSEFKEIKEKLGLPDDFKCNQATEAQREHVEEIFVELTQRGYSFEPKADTTTAEETSK